LAQGRGHCVSGPFSGQLLPHPAPPSRPAGMAPPLAAALLLAATAAATAQEAAPGRGLRGAGAAASQGPPALPPRAGALFSALDRDGDGALTLREAQAAAGAAQELAAGLFGAADADGSGAVGPEEFGSMAGVLQRRQRGGRSWEEALQLRAAARRASAAETTQTTTYAERRDNGEGLSNKDGENLDETVEGKDPWTPHAECEMYTNSPCGGPLFPGWPNRTCSDGVSTCNPEGICICPDGYCSSTRVGYCTRCDDWDADAGPGSSSCSNKSHDLI